LALRDVGRGEEESRVIVLGEEEGIVRGEILRDKLFVLGQDFLDAWVRNLDRQAMLGGLTLNVVNASALTSKLP
jgi:hypothetical protein